MHAVAGAQAAQRRLPVPRAAEVGHDHDEPARPREPGHRRRGLAERRRAGALRRGPVAQLGEQAEQPGAALARAQHARLRAAEGDHAEPVPAPRRHVADGQRDALGDVGLAPQRGAELHRGRDVEHQPRRHRALADVHADVRLAHPRGHVPVDVAHVVARLVGADQRQLGAGADLRRRVLAGDERLDPPHHGEVERAQDRVGDRPRTRLGRGPLGLGRSSALHGSRPLRISPVTIPASSRISAPPANAAVTSCFSLRVARPLPRFA